MSSNSPSSPSPQVKSTSSNQQEVTALSILRYQQPTSMVRCRAATSLMSLISLVTLTLLPLDNIAALQITSPLFVPPHSNHGRSAVVPLTTNRYGPGVACNGSIRCHQRSHAIENSRIRYSIAPLFSSANGSSQEEEGKSPKRRQPVQTIKGIIMKIVRFFATAPAKFMAYYRRLTKKGKIILAMQLMTLGLLMGAAAKTTATAKTNQANRPVEVSYSTFLDLVDVNGKGHKPGKHPALKLDNVIISKDRVGFRVVTDKEKHELALIDKKLVQKEDVSVIAPAESTRTIYAMKPMASQELIETLREHEVPFRAASTKGANTAANVARFSIFLVYLLFLSRMYKAMGGGGGTGGGSGAPGKLATFTPGEALVKFDDIEGIDEAKFEVMELVDTLRNPKKYEILGARAPTGLLLEGPPGTGEKCLRFFVSAFSYIPRGWTCCVVLGSTSEALQ